MWQNKQTNKVKEIIHCQNYTVYFLPVSQIATSSSPPSNEDRMAENGGQLKGWAKEPVS